MPDIEQTKKDSDDVSSLYANVFPEKSQEPVKKRNSNFQGFSGSTLKIVAIITMFIDHFAAIVLGDRINQLLVASNHNYEALATEPIYYIMMGMRCIGRLGFPLFCFLLIEGFVHTHDKVKYAVRLFIFALISEIPFDIAFNSKILEFTYQNVFFTLFIGLVVLMGLEKVNQKFFEKPRLCSWVRIAVVIIGVIVAVLLRTDYNGIGIIAIVIMYWFRHNRKTQTITGCIALCIGTPLEVFAFLILPLTTHYNGKRGINLKYFFYAFYPVHILLLVGISMLLGFR